MTSSRLFRAVFMLLAGACLLIGMNAGLRLLDIWAPLASGRVAAAHGPLMVLGFVGALIALERAVALGRLAGFAAPGLLAVGALLLVTPAPPIAGQLMLVGGAFGQCLIYIPLYRRNLDPAIAVQALGALLAVCATILLIRSVPVAAVVPWLGGFVVLTILGERIELARLAFSSRGATATALLLAGSYLAACVASLLWPAVGYPLLGVVVIAICTWFAVHDVASKTVRSSGLPRFIAVCLLAAYAWLGIAGVGWLLARGIPTGEAYDAIVHAVFLGFTISMIMAHAPVILPAVLRRPLPYRASFYVPVGLLQLSLLIRVVIGDAHGSAVARETGSALNVAAILLFGLLAVTASVSHARRTQATAETATTEYPAISAAPAIAETSATAPTASAVAVARDSEPLLITTSPEAGRAQA